jgi:hypothetical protein
MMGRRNNRSPQVIQAAYPQLVVNPSAEAGGAEPDGWFHSLTGTEWSNGEAHSGNRSLRLNVSDGVADWRCAVYPVAGGSLYRVGLWLKGTATPETVVAVRWFSDSEGAHWITEEWIVLTGVYADWTHMERTVTAPANAQSSDLMFRAAFATTADTYGDDFSVRQVN